MNTVFTEHFTVAEARELLPQVRAWFNEVDALTDRIRKSDECLAPRLKAGADLGGSEVSSQFRDMGRVQSIISEFNRRQIQIKDLQRDLIDFPAILDEREVFLCWERSENDLTHWHDLESGFAGRQPLLEYEQDFCNHHHRAVGNGFYSKRPKGRS